MFKRFGPQHWWPADSPSEESRRFEIAVGAILTQNVSWGNAAQAVKSLQQKRLLSPAALDRLPAGRLAPLIRPSGYFNQKAKKLKGFARYLLKRHGGRMDRMKQLPWPRLRRELMNLSGIGPETADSILLYALQKPLFVVDAYTRRILARHSLISWEASYGQIQALFMENLDPKVGFYNGYHALLVALGKDLCRKSAPLCHQCPLRSVGHLKLESRLTTHPSS